MSRPQLSKAILRDSLPPDIDAIIDQATTNVDRAVDQVVEAFKQQALARAEQYANGSFDAELAGLIQRLRGEVEAQLEAVTKAQREVAQALTKAHAAAEGAQELGRELEAAMAEVRKQGEALDAAVNATREKVRGFGGTAGRAIASTVMKTVGLV